MIYTVGYGKDLGVEGLKVIIEKHQIGILIDLRSKPYSQWRSDVNRKALEKAIPQYQWRGDILGGFSQIKESDIDNLSIKGKTKNLLLMCAEKDYRKCHRELIIASRFREIGCAYTHLER